MMAAIRKQQINFNKLQKRLRRKVGRAIQEINMIEDGDRVMVSTDGVSVGSLASQSGDHSEPVDTLAVERIGVVKGPATLLYGSNAIGGVVNAISGHDEAAHPGVRGYFSAFDGTNNAQGGASGGIEYGIGNWMLWGNGSTQRTGNYKAGGNFGTVENTFTRNAAGSGVSKSAT